MLRQEVPVDLKVFKSKNGFSLLEILIVTAIMGAIAVIASTAIKGGLRNKKKLDARLRVESSVFDALRLMSTDIERAFHYQYTFYEIDRTSVTGGTPPGQPTGNPQDPVQPIPPERLTNIIGKDSSLHFTTLNHFRTTANAPESNQIEVGYYIENCRSRTTQQDSRCLWRRSSTIIDNDVTRGGEATPLLENVTELKFEYLSEDKNEKEWKKEWMSDVNGGNNQNMFPIMIKIFLSIEDKKNKEFGKFQQTIIASVRSTNNVDPAKRFQPPTNPDGTPPGTPPDGGGGAPQ